MYENLIRSLIKSKKEGTNWDFKQEHTDNDVDFVHDVICMANNLEFIDSYLIYGVSNDFQIVGLEESKTMTQVNLNNILKNVKFAGDYKPVVFVDHIELDGKLLDIVIIKASYNTPYFLAEDYGSLQKNHGKIIRANHIYTRNNDSNTDINKSASIHQVEQLWSRKFRLQESPLSQVEYYLDNKENWKVSPYESINKITYNINRPEFTIEEVYDDENDAYVFFILNQCDTSPGWYYVYIKYHQTILYSVQGISLDGGRAFVTTPNNKFLELYEANTSEPLSYRYYRKDELNYKLFDFFYDKRDEYSEQTIAIKRFMENLIIFENEEEFNSFNDYIDYNKQKIKDEIENFQLDKIIMPEISGYRIEYFKKLKSVIIVLKKIFEEFKTIE